MNSVMAAGLPVNGTSRKGTRGYMEFFKCRVSAWISEVCGFSCSLVQSVSPVSRCRKCLRTKAV